MSVPELFVCKGTMSYGSPSVSPVVIVFECSEILL